MWTFKYLFLSARQYEPPLLLVHSLLEQNQTKRMHAIIQTNKHSCSRSYLLSPGQSVSQSVIHSVIHSCIYFTVHAWKPFHSQAFHGTSTCSIEKSQTESFFSSGFDLLASSYAAGVHCFAIVIVVVITSIHEKLAEPQARQRSAQWPLRPHRLTCADSCDKRRSRRSAKPSLLKALSACSKATLTSVRTCIHTYFTLYMVSGSGGKQTLRL